MRQEMVVRNSELLQCRYPHISLHYHILRLMEVTCTPSDPAIQKNHVVY